MKKPFGVLLSLAALPFTLAVKNSTASFALLTQLPQCALTCLATSVADSTCVPTDFDCVCTNVPLNDAITACVKSSCTIRQSLMALNITHTLCEDPVRDRRDFYNTLSNVLGVTTGVAVVLRFYSRWKSAQEFWYDDYSIIFIMVIGIPSTVMNVHGLTYNGLGLDIWRVEFHQITDFMHVFFAVQILYFVQVGAVKMGILFFYLRLFPSPTFRKWVWATIIFNTLFTIVFLFIGLFQCRPIGFYWKRWDNEHQGSCVDINALGWANAGISIALDLWMLALPMTQFLHLNLHWKKKLSVAAMLGVGAFVTIVSMIRLQFLVRLSNTHNPTWDYIPIGYWSTLEINVGIICACMPSIRLLLLRAFPRLMGTPNDRSYVYSHNRRGGTGKNKIPVSNSTEASSGGWTQTRVSVGATLSSKGRDEGEKVQTTGLELVRVESGKAGDEDVSGHHSGNWA